MITPKKCMHTHLLSSTNATSIKCQDSQIDTSLISDQPSLYNDIMLNSLEKNCINYDGINANYLSFRKEGINFLKKLTIKFKLCDKTFHLALALLDKLFVKITAYKEVNLISYFCLILAVKYSDDEAYKANIIGKEYSSKVSTNYQTDEIYILNLLNYDLNIATSYDIMTFLLYRLFISNRMSNKNAFEHMAYAFLNKFIELKASLKLTAYQIASGILKQVGDKFGLTLFEGDENCWVGYETFAKELAKSKKVFNKLKKAKEKDLSEDVKPSRNSNNSLKSNISTDDDVDDKEKQLL